MSDRFRRIVQDRCGEGMKQTMDANNTTILIVDDEPDVVEALQHFFSAKGYEAVGVFSGEEALCVLAERKVDLVLLDIRLPGLQGTEVARFIKEKYPAIKLIVITAYPEEGDKLAGDTVLDGLFIKPLGVQEIYTKLLDVLEPREAPPQESSHGQRIKARVILIKAKLLFVEPSPSIYDSVRMHLRELAWKGENYESEVAHRGEEVIEKLSQVQPDILILNLSYLNSLDIDFIEMISHSFHKPKEIIIYSSASSQALDATELSRLVKTIQAFCLKNGLVEIKWVDI